ncbi:hypothetical protein [Marinitoga litoralis]|jgi:hypothetical protein|uniref:hypothetical protein n=1 Tax=Marinitoga litoralis TaxID=570855 RepID=UPI001960661D|nr:hypothetical protein [Marinitoga litoralis]MBM7558546.1 hypothetical protein [Marinitoga litoralis]
MKYKLYQNNKRKYLLDLDSVTLVELDEIAYSHLTENKKNKDVEKDIKTLKI